MSARTFVIGVGMTKFDKPGTKEGDYPDWAKEAGEKALADAGIPYDGRRAGLRRLLLRRLDLRPAGALPARPDRDPGRQRQQQLLDRLLGAVPRPPGGQGRARRLRARGRLREDGEGLARGQVHRPHQRARQARDARCSSSAIPEESPPAPQMFGNAGRDHMEKYGSKPDHYAWIGWKNHKHSVNNPYAQFQDEYSLDEIKDARMIHEPLTKLQCSPTSDGSGVRDRRLRALRRRARPLGPGDRDRRPVDGHRPLARPSPRTPTASRSSATTCRRQAAEQAYEEAGDLPPTTSTSASCTTASRANELITYEALGFAAEGEGHKLVEAEATTYGGDGPVVNPSGGLISQGPPARRDRARAVLASSPGSCAARPTSARSTARRWPSSTTSASAAPPSSPSTSRHKTLARPTNNERLSDEHDHDDKSDQRAVHRRAARLPGRDPRLRRARVRDRGAARAAHRRLHRAAQPGDLREARRARLARRLDRRGVRRLRRRAWSTPASSSRRRCAAWSRSPATASA